MTRFTHTILAIVVCLLFASTASSDSGDQSSQKKTNPSRKVVSANYSPPSVKEAKQQADLLHMAMHATLHVVHHEYYREDEGLAIPAATMKDVFAHVEEEQHVKLRWLVVEGQAMNTDHLPQDEFSKQAVQALKSGEDKFERVENGVYRRAGGILLTNHCLKCHVPDRKSTENRTAGLLISIPVREK